MHVTATVVGGETHDLELDASATYADVLRAVDLSPQEATVLVDDTPVPDDRPVETTEVRILRLVEGG